MRQVLAPVLYILDKHHLLGNNVRMKMQFPNKGVIFMLWRTIMTLLLTAAFCFSAGHQSLAKDKNSICNKNEEKEHQVMGRLSVKTPEITNVHLKTTYLDGVSIVNVVNDHFISSENVMTKYDGWHVATCHEKDVFLYKKVNDLSPISKTAGIFGLKDGNILTLYKGSPDENQVIQTFFQIDVNALEADAANQLKEGIRISNKNDFKKVLDSFSKYAITHRPKIENRS